MPTDAEVAWLAGLLEGEGYFGVIRSHVGGKVYVYPRIGVTMTDRDVVQRAVTIMGAGKVHPVKPYGASRKPQYRLHISGRRAAEWMGCLRPWMGERRREQIDAALNHRILRDVA
jgi:hypothetical protein